MFYDQSMLLSYDQCMPLEHQPAILGKLVLRVSWLLFQSLKMGFSFLNFFIQLNSGTTNNHRTGLSDIILKPFQSSFEWHKEFPKLFLGVEKNRCEMFDGTSFSNE